MKNILLEKYLELTGGVELYDWYAAPNLTIGSFQLRDDYVHKYSWAIPNKTAIDALIEHSPIVEIGAGTGYWAALIAEAGGNILAFDPHPPRINSTRNPYHENQTTVFPVKRGGPKVAAKYSDRTLFLCWPPYNSKMAHQTLQAYNGNTVIFIGEGMGGCTGDDEFFRLLEYEFCIEKEIEIPQWPGIHDRMMIFSRVTPSMLLS